MGCQIKGCKKDHVDIDTVSVSIKKCHINTEVRVCKEHCKLDCYENAIRCGVINKPKEELVCQ